MVLASFKSETEWRVYDAHVHTAFYFYFILNFLPCVDPVHSFLLPPFRGQTWIDRLLARLAIKTSLGWRREMTERGHISKGQQKNNVTHWCIWSSLINWFLINSSSAREKPEQTLNKTEAQTISWFIPQSLNWTIQFLLTHMRYYSHTLPLCTVSTHQELREQACSYWSAQVCDSGLSMTAQL